MIGFRSRALQDMTFLEFILFITVNIVFSFIFYQLTIKNLENSK